MYSICLFCRASLGRNDVVEPFPVGRRVAFDAERGRLWAVCPRCRRWNLAPLEERWEAVELCERVFPRTGLHVSTANVGMARLADGTDLVRIGRPVRAELAAWRWGDLLRARARAARTREEVATSARTAAELAFHTAVQATLGWGAAFGLGSLLEEVDHLFRRHVLAARVPVAGGAPLVMRGRHLMRAALVSGGGEEGWGLRLPHTRGETTLAGAPALGAARYLLARLNRGETSPRVEPALARLEAGGTPGEHFGALARGIAEVGARRGLDDLGSVAELPAEVRLAMEMAATEETERRAMEGELALLEREWRQAEELAAISDSLLVPETVTAWLQERRAESPR
jgi:hypothetical protein